MTPEGAPLEDCLECLEGENKVIDEAKRASWLVMDRVNAARAEMQNLRLDREAVQVRVEARLPVCFGVFLIREKITPS